MLDIKKHFVVDEDNKTVAVQISIEAFRKIEKLLEDYALTQMMMEVETEPNLDLESAKHEYQQLPLDIITV